MTPRENILKALRREGFESVPVDYVLCESQIENFQKRFGHNDYETHFGLCHRSFEMNVQRNYTSGADQFKRETLPDSTVFDEYGMPVQKVRHWHFTWHGYTTRLKVQIWMKFLIILIQASRKENWRTLLGRWTTLSRLNRCGEKGEIVIGPTHMVEPEVPCENLTAIIEGVKSFQESRK